MLWRAKDKPETPRSPSSAAHDTFSPLRGPKGTRAPSLAKREKVAGGAGRMRGGADLC
jgi:hypothetical protein